MDEKLLDTLFEQSLLAVARKMNLTQEEIEYVREEQKRLKEELTPEYFAGTFIIMIIEQAATAYATKGIQ